MLRQQEGFEDELFLFREEGGRPTNEYRILLDKGTPRHTLIRI
jgi:hypothetical protein